MSNINVEQLSAAQKANAEVMTQLMRTAFEGVQKLTELNMTVTRDFFDTTIANANTLMSAKDVNEAAKLSQAITQPSIDQLVGYSRSVYQLVADMQKEITSVMESQYSQFTKNAATAIDKTKATPVGGDVFAAAMKSMLDATSSAYNNMTSITKQMTDIAEANLQAATNVTSKTVGSATRSAAKK